MKWFSICLAIAVMMLVGLVRPEQSFATDNGIGPVRAAFSGVGSNRALVRQSRANAQQARANTVAFAQGARPAAFVPVQAGACFSGHCQVAQFSAVPVAAVPFAAYAPVQVQTFSAVPIQVQAAPVATQQVTTTTTTTTTQAQPALPAVAVPSVQLHVPAQQFAIPVPVQVQAAPHCVQPAVAVPIH